MSLSLESHYLQAVGDPFVKRRFMNTTINIIISVFISVASNVLGDFKNLDFEAADLRNYPPGDPFIPVEKEMPGWSAYYGGDQTSYVAYNALSLGSSVISIFDNTTVYPQIFSIDGNYSTSLDARTSPVTISQTGTIPSASLSVVFLIRNIRDGSLVVTFDGNALLYGKTWSEPAFDVYTANISAYAGKTGDLRFTENSGCNVIDDIQFSSEPFTVPEPGTVSLFALGAIALAGRYAFRRRDSDVPAP